MGTQDQPEIIDLRRIVGWWRIHWRWLGLGLILGAGAALTEKAMFEPHYTAQGMVYIADYRALVLAATLTTPPVDGQAPKFAVPEGMPLAMLFPEAKFEGRLVSLEGQGTARDSAINEVSRQINGARMLDAEMKRAFVPLLQAMTAAGVRMAELLADPGVVIVTPAHIVRVTAFQKVLLIAEPLAGLLAVFLIGTIICVFRQEP